MSKYFETIKIENGAIFHIPYHQERMQRTCGVCVALEEYIDPPKEGLIRCKVVYDETGVLDVRYYPYEKRVIRSLKLVDIGFDYSKKYYDRSKIEAAFAKRRTCDEVLFVKDGLITDTSIANVAFFDGTRWLTPKKPLLAGTTRKRYLKTDRLRMEDIQPDMMKNFSHIALLNAMIDFDIMSIAYLRKDCLLVE